MIITEGMSQKGSWINCSRILIFWTNKPLMETMLSQSKRNSMNIWHKTTFTFLSFFSTRYIFPLIQLWLVVINNPNKKYDCAYFSTWSVLSVWKLSNLKGKGYVCQGLSRHALKHEHIHVTLASDPPLSIHFYRLFPFIMQTGIGSNSFRLLPRRFYCLSVEKQRHSFEIL